MLQWYGLNLYIRAHPEAATMNLVPAKDKLRDRGTLRAVFEEIRVQVLPTPTSPTTDQFGLQW
jgi:hypothetical protein